MLEHEGRLMGIQVGNRVIYPYSQIVELFGEPEPEAAARYLRPCYDEHAA